MKGAKEADTHMQSGKRMRERESGNHIDHGSSASLKPSSMSNLGFQRALLHHTKYLNQSG